jgi:MerR family redox-sensitive transcriptional activator SoxR
MGEGESMAATSRAGKFDWHLDGLTVGEVAERMHVAPSAVRYYADQGLLPHSRTPTNERRFHVDVLCRVAMIQVAQRVGMSLAEIRDALTDLPPGQVPAPADWQRLSARLRQTLHGRIEEMFTLLDELANDLTAPVSTPVPMTEPAAGQQGPV